MSEPYVGEIRMFAGNFAPESWAFCDGQLLRIVEHDLLFNLIGTTYGGDGRTTFALPDLRGRLPAHQGNGFAVGASGGVEQVALTAQQMPAHSHPFVAASVTGDSSGPQDLMPANSLKILPYIQGSPNGACNASAITPTGGSQPHSNMQPYLCVDFIISLAGAYPQPA